MRWRSKMFAGRVGIGSGTLSTLTQPHAADNCPVGATVLYALQPDPANAAQKVLQETDQRYGTNTLVHNVTTFSVTAVSGVPGLYQVDLVVGSPAIEECHDKVYSRN